MVCLCQYVRGKGGAHDLTRLGGQRVMAESPELSDGSDGAKRHLDQQERKRTEQPALG